MHGFVRILRVLHGKACSGAHGPTAHLGAGDQVPHPWTGCCAEQSDAQKCAGRHLAHGNSPPCPWWRRSWGHKPLGRFAGRRFGNSENVFRLGSNRPVESSSLPTTCTGVRALHHSVYPIRIFSSLVYHICIIVSQRQTIVGADVMMPC